MSVIYLKKNQCLWTAKGLNCYDIDSPSKLIRLQKLQTTLGQRARANCACLLGPGEKTISFPKLTVLGPFRADGGDRVLPSGNWVGLTLDGEFGRDQRPLTPDLSHANHKV